MTQLIIDGQEAVLPQDFSCTVKRENSLFTKNGEYTYDVNLRLDNPTNRALYDFLHRVNKTDSYRTGRKAELIADGHAFTRGTEIVTRWTEDTVTIQIVSGASELNYFIGQNKKISELDMGEIEAEDIAEPFIQDPELCYPDIDYCMPTIVEEGKEGAINFWIYNEDLDADRHWYDFGRTYVNTMAAQPYLCAILRRMLVALGYQIGLFEIEDTQFRNLFFVNRKYTKKYNEMFAGWTVKDLLEEVEKLTNCCFLTDNNNMRVNVLLRHTFYLSATQFTIRNVIDAYEAEVDTEEQNADISSADIIYDLDDDDFYNMMRLPEVVNDYVEYRHYNTFDELRLALEALSPTEKVIGVNDATGRKYVRRQDTSDETEWEGSEMNRRRHLKLQKLDEVDMFADLRREDGNGEVELKLIPAPMGTWTASMDQIVTEEGQYGEVDLQTYGGLVAIPAITSPQSDTSTVDSDEEEGPKSVIDLIKSAEEKSEDSQIKLYIAFYNGLHGPFVGDITSFKVGVAYTDAEHAFAFSAPADTMTYEGSLQTSVIDAATYSNGYQIDTRHTITFETYDPNVIDVRQVYVIQNRRFVVRDVEEVIDNEGRQQRWKLTCYPITISDEALAKRWVLTQGVWDDGAAWLDDGRWNDSNPN